MIHRSLWEQRLRAWINTTEGQVLKSSKLIFDTSRCLSSVLNLTSNFTHPWQVSVAVLLFRKSPRFFFSDLSVSMHFIYAVILYTSLTAHPVTAHQCAVYRLTELNCFNNISEGFTWKFDVSSDSHVFFFFFSWKKEWISQWINWFIHPVNNQPSAGAGLKTIWIINNMYHHILYRIACQQNTSGCADIGKESISTLATGIMYRSCVYTTMWEHINRLMTKNCLVLLHIIDI